MLKSQTGRTIVVTIRTRKQVLLGMAVVSAHDISYFYRARCPSVNDWMRSGWCPEFGAGCFQLLLLDTATQNNKDYINDNKMNNS